MIQLCGELFRTALKLIFETNSEGVTISVTVAVKGFFEIAGITLTAAFFFGEQVLSDAVLCEGVTC